MDVTLNEQAKAAESLTAILELLRLDAIWTHYVDRGATIPDEDWPTLRTIASRMDELLSTFPETAQWVSGVVSCDTQAFERVLSQNVISAHPRPDVWTHAEDRLVADHLAVSLIAQAATESLQTSERERADIAGKLGLLERGQQITGDISHSGMCALIVAIQQASAA